jgi:hypothetical protein
MRYEYALAGVSSAAKPSQLPGSLLEQPHPAEERRHPENLARQLEKEIKAIMA